MNCGLHAQSGPAGSGLTELRPRDFTARFRRVRTARGAKARLRAGRAALALAAIAVPAFAATDDWSAFAIGDAGPAQVVPQAMPFESAGSSFPGSAFYYLSDDETQPRAWGEGVFSDAQDAPTAIEAQTGGLARAMRIDMSGVDRTRALQCLTAAIYYEAASEADAGQRAVAQVVLNRVAHPAYPNTVCGVVYQGSERSTGCQFSFTCDGALARVPNRMFWRRAEMVALSALSGYVYAPVGLATHYHTVQIHPYWADSLNYLGTIGAHRFYRFRGAAGASATFRYAYLGGEPIAAPHPHSDRADANPASTIDPVAVQRTYDEALQATQAGAADAPGPLSSAVSAAKAPAGVGAAALAPAPNYTPEQQNRGGEAVYRGDRLPGGAGVRPEYEQSGRWIAEPGA